MSRILARVGMALASMGSLSLRIFTVSRIARQDACGFVACALGDCRRASSVTGFSASLRKCPLRASLREETDLL